MFGAVNKFAGAVRLPEIRRLPTREDLKLVLVNCDRARDKFVVQTWARTPADRYTLRTIILASGPEYVSLKMSGKQDDPEWAFIKGDDLDADVLWAHRTTDMELIYKLIMTELEDKRARSSSTNLNPVIGADPNAAPLGTPTAVFDAFKKRVVEAATVRSAQQQQLLQQQQEFQQQQAQTQQLPQAMPFGHATPTRSYTGLNPIDVGNSMKSTQPLPGSGGPDTQPGTAAPQGIVLAGDIRDIELQNVLQSIQLCKMNGALLINNNLEQASVYFLEGEIVDATMQRAFSISEHESDLRGDHAFLELLTWTNGAFTFEQTRRSSTTSITRKSYALLMEGVMLRDYWDNLSKKGVDLETRFVQVHPPVTEAEFEARLKQGLPLEVDLQKQIYQAMRAPLSVYEMLKTRPMSKAVWVPLIFNLLSLNLVQFADEAKQVEKPQVVDTFQIEDTLVTNFSTELIRPDSGLVSHAGFTYFVNQELVRFKKTGRVFSILVFEVRIRRGSSLEPLSNVGLRECANRFKSIMGELDTIGHYQMLDFGLLLPEGAIADASSLFESCAKVLKSPPLPAVENEELLQVTISIYMPDHNARIVLKDRKRYGSK
jgi:hypothetical protein